jgi:hypothetical protein
VAADRADGPPGTPTRLLNGGLLAALVINAGGNFASGTYDVIWSLFLQGLGAGLGLIGLTFAMFGLPILLLSPMAGRLIDRRGAFPFIVIGSVLPAVSGFLYTLLEDPVLAVPLILIEATGFAFLLPALRSRRRQLAAGNRDRPGRVRGRGDRRVHRGLTRGRGARGGGHPVSVRVQRRHDGDLDRRAVIGGAPQDLQLSRPTTSGGTSLGPITRAPIP